MLQLKDISKTYVSKTGQKIKALDSVTLEFKKGQLVFVVGKSGCGKSTLLNILGGLDKYDGGEILIDGISTKEFSAVDFDYYRNKYIGFVFQEYNLLEEDNIEKNISLALKLQKNSADKSKIEEMLHKFGLIGYGARMPDELSGGQKQRIAIARALIKSPEIILADEPTGALDSESGKQIFEILKEIAKEKLVIVVSHDNEYAKTYGDRIIELSDGKVISDTVKVSTLKESDKKNNNEERKIQEIVKPEDIVNKPENNISISESSYKSKVKKHTGFAEKSSHLTGKDALIIGISGLKKRKLRLITAIFLASVSLFLFGICSTMFIYNRYKPIVNTMYESDRYSITLRKQALRITYQESDNGTYGLVSGTLNDSDISYISKKFKGNTVVPVLDIYEGSIGDYFGNLKPTNYFFNYYCNFTGAIEMNEKLAAKFRYKLLNGRYPVENNEIMISEYIYLYFERFGYRDPATDTIFEINAYEDLIGRTINNENINNLIGGVKIVGILDNGSHKYIDLLRTEDEIIDYENGLLGEFLRETSYFGNSFNYIYLNPGHYANRAHFYKSYNNIKNTKSTSIILNNSMINGDNGLISYNTTYSYVMSKMGAFPYRAKQDAATPVIDGFPFDVYWANNIERKTLSGNEIIIPLELLEQIYIAEEKTTGQLIEELRAGTLPDCGSYDGLFKVVGAYSLEESDEYEYIATTFVSNAYYEKNIKLNCIYDYSYAAIALTGNLNKDARFLNSVDEKKLSVEYGYDTFRFMNNIKEKVLSMEQKLIVLKWVALGTGALMAIFAGVMIFNYFAISIIDKKKEIGILRALGARKIDVFNIFISRGIIIALINAVIGTILTAIGIVVINSLLKTQFMIGITLLSFGFLTVVSVLVLSLITMLLGSLIPIRRIAGQSPADAIKTL